MISEIVDSSIVIDHLNGHRAASHLIASLDAPAISIVTWIEVVTGFRDSEAEAVGRRFLLSLELVQLSSPIAEETVLVRRTTRLKLPDAVILATARISGATLLTRNTRDFPPGTPGVHVPYSL